jgi:hypothetical protein
MRGIGCKLIRLGRQSGQYDAEIDQKYRKNVRPCSLTPLNVALLGFVSMKGR